MTRKTTPRSIGFHHISTNSHKEMNETSQKFVNNTFPASANDSFQFQSYFILAMSNHNHNKQTNPPLLHEAHPPLCCSKPPAAPGVLLEKPINRPAVTAGPPYSQCYYPDTPFQKFQAHHQFSVGETNKSKSPLPPAAMDPSTSLNSNASNNGSIKRTNLMEHIRSPTEEQTKSPLKEGEFCHPFLPPFGSG